MGKNPFMDRTAVMAMIPHRPPFLLVDEIQDCEPGNVIRGSRTLAPEDPFLQNGRMPAVLLVEALAQASVILTYKTLNVVPSGTDLMVLAGLERARFSEEGAGAGDRLELHSKLVRIRQSIGWFDGSVNVRERPVCSVRMIAAILKL